MAFSHEHHIFMVEAYFRNGQRHLDGRWEYNTSEALADFRNQYPDMVFTDGMFFRCIRDVVSKFRTTGSVCRKGGSGRQKRVRTEEKIGQLRRIIEERPSTSLRRLAQETDVSYTTARTILKTELHLHPYKVQSFHELKPPDFPLRVEYCNWFNEHLNNNDILDLTFFSDEAWFHLSGYVNSQNMRIWSAENPHAFVEQPLHPAKIGVFIAVSRRRLIGPIFFEETVTGELYRHQLLQPMIEQLMDDELREGYFQQDRAPAHAAAETLGYLREFYDDRLISRNCTIKWPPRSPDLTPLDYSIFPYLKNNVFKQPINNLFELQQRFEETCRQISPRILENIFENMKRRVALCLQEQGQHFEHLL